MRERHRQHGYSLVEISIVVIVLAVMSAVIAQSMRGLSASQQSARALAKIGSLAERVVARIETDIRYTTKVWDEGAEARELLARLDLANPTEGALLAGSRLPVATIAGVFGPDPADAVQTGNMLLLARRDGTVRVESSIDSTPLPRRVDLFRFVLWHLHAGGPTGVDLARWCSVRIARLADIEVVADAARRARLVTDLVELGVTVAWTPGASAAAAFQNLGSDGSIAPFAVDDLVGSDGDLGEVGIMALRNVGVAPNRSSGAMVPRFATATAGFPHGFELKRDGNGAGDLLLVRLVVATPLGPQRQVLSFEAARQMAFREE